MYTSALYRHSPVFIQELLISAWSGVQKTVREGAVFEALFAETEARQYWHPEQLHHWCTEQLRTILHHAQTVVPYYRQHYHHFPLEIGDPIQCLERYSLLHKYDIINNPAAFIATDISRYRRFSSKTSGTTGTPLTLYKTFSSINRENAFVWRQMHWANYQKGQRMAWLRGDLIVPEPLFRKTPFWRLDRCANTLRMSSYHLSERNALAYLEALRKFDPVLIQAYPSSIGYLANWLWQRGQCIRIKSLKSIMTSSETLTQEQRERIETTFSVKVFDWYGGSERVTAIGTCEYGHYHIMEDYGYTEFGTPQNNGLCEIIGTGFINHLMPLIRYATGDLIEPETSGAPCACKRPFRRVKRVLGRMNDVIKTSDGRTIGLIDPIYNGLSEIAEAQIVQNALDSIEIRVVPVAHQPLTQETRNCLISNIRGRVGWDMDVHVIEMDSLPRTNNGKIRTIVSNL